MKKLIVDYLPFEIKPEQISESINENNGKLIVRGVLQRAEAKNQNGRVYPREILHREAKKYTKEFIKERRAMGELDHPESSVVNLQNVSHNIKEMHWEGDNLLGTVEVLSTPSGNILKELFKSGIKLGISSRGMGSVETVNEDDGQVTQVQPDFEL
ncbi:MAG TPA: primosomal protein, partial [Maribacter sp.]|nr:primosomal protein [Maribacter sp.]